LILPFADPLSFLPLFLFVSSSLPFRFPPLFPFVSPLSSQVAAQGHKVHSVEPMAYNLELLSASVEANGFDELVTVHKSAVGAQRPEGVPMTTM
jgi:hypothetical protein